MNKQFPIVVTLAALCAVPAFLLAERTQVRLVAFASERQAMPLERLLTGAGVEPEATAATSLVPPAPRVRARTRAARIVAAETPRAVTCADWRTLEAGPRASAVSVSSVRSCDGAVEAPPASSVHATAARGDVAAPPAARPMEFLVDLSAP